LIFDRLAQAFKGAHDASEINIRNLNKEMPSNQARVARAEPHGFGDMGSSFPLGREKTSSAHDRAPSYQTIHSALHPVRGA
jgi:hypothetical protein